MTLLYAYNFDEASGNILDVSGNGRNTVLGGSLARTASGAGHTDKGMSQSSNAFDSNGPALSGLQTAQFTFMAWIKRSNNAQNGWIGELKDAGSGDRGILFLSGAIQGRARNSGGTVQNVSTTQPTANTWYHAAVTYSTVDAKVHLYINGSEIGTGAALTAPLKTTSTSSSLFDECGAETIIDDVRYYDIALDAATITTLMGTPVSAGASLTLGLVTETDSAFSLTRAKSRALGQATEADSALPVSRSKSRAFGLTTETDTPPALAPAKATSLGLVASDESALTLSATKIKAFGLPSEVNDGFPIGLMKSLALGLPSTVETAFTLGRSKSRVLGLVSEFDTVFALVLTGGATLVLGLITEVDSVFPLVRAKVKAFGLVSETESAFALGGSKSLVLGEPNEADSTSALSFAKEVTLGLTQEDDVALALDLGDDSTVTVWHRGVAIEVALANVRVWRHGQAHPITEIEVSGAEG